VEALAPDTSDSAGLDWSVGRRRHCSLLVDSELNACPARSLEHLMDRRTFLQQTVQTSGTSSMTKILLVQGANLTFLGRREPAIYGTTTPAELDAMLQRHAGEHGYHLEIFYSNIEGKAINRIYQAVDEGFDGLVMNPAGFSYAGFALRDCLKGAALPYVEVHISSIAKRNIHCVLSDVAEGLITGFGMHSYILGLEAMLEILRTRRQPARP
jgi:3-dehydroquinate dehydratase-2